MREHFWIAGVGFFFGFWLGFFFWANCLINFSIHMWEMQLEILLSWVHRKWLSSYPTAKATQQFRDATTTRTHELLPPGHSDPAEPNRPSATFIPTTTTYVSVLQIIRQEERPHEHQMKDICTNIQFWVNVSTNTPHPTPPKKKRIKKIPNTYVQCPTPIAQVKS